jgi:DNA-directed RNA polymerase sigma subunit (sigma70/sigma32)
MSNDSEATRNQLEAFNKWLNDVYGEGTRLDTLLEDAGFTEIEIEAIMQKHKSNTLDAFNKLLESYNGSSVRERNILMVLHYGLSDGNPLDFYEISPDFGVCGSRIRQLVNIRINFYRNPQRQEQLKRDMASIAWQLLNEESA